MLAERKTISTDTLEEKYRIRPDQNRKNRREIFRPPKGLKTKNALSVVRRRAAIFLGDSFASSRKKKLFEIERDRGEGVTIIEFIEKRLVSRLQFVDT